MLRSKKILAYYLLLTISVSLFVFLVIASFHTTWMHPDVLFKDVFKILRYGNSFGLADFKSTLIDVFESGEARVRYFTSLFSRFDQKSRIWLWQYVTPHPSFTPTAWLLGLVLTPLFLYKFVRKMSPNPIVAWNSVLLFCMSTGSLSSLVVFFARAKPVVVFLTVFSIYQATKLSPSSFRLRNWNALALLIAMFVAYTTDEYGYFIFICIPVLFYDKKKYTGAVRSLLEKSNFKTKWPYIRTAILYCSPLLLLLFLVTFVLPPVAYRLGQDFNLWSHLFKRRLDGAPVWTKFEIKNVLFNGRQLLASHIVPLKSSPWYKYTVYSLFLWLPYFGLLYSKLPPGEKKFARNTFITLVTLVLVLSVIHLGHVTTIDSPFYYGSNFSIFFSILAGTLLSVNVKPFGAINKVLLVIMLVISGINFLDTNRSWIEEHRYWYKDSSADEASQMPGGIEMELNHTMAKEIWSNRKNVDYLLSVKPKLNNMSYWLFKELENVTNPIVLPDPKLEVDGLQRITLSPSMIQVASAKDTSHGVPQLVDDDIKTSWLANSEGMNIPWVRFDLATKKAIRVIRLYIYGPPSWIGCNTFWQVSHDGITWISIARLQNAKNEGPEWVSYTVPSNQEFEHYRLRFVELNINLGEVQLFAAAPP